MVGTLNPFTNCCEQLQGCCAAGLNLFQLLQAIEVLLPLGNCSFHHVGGLCRHYWVGAR